MATGASEPIDLVVNCFERTYRRALEPGAFPALAEANRFRFSRRVALINNVEDGADAKRRAERLVAAGEIDEFHFVADRLQEALRRTGLRASRLEPLLHYSDAPLVAATLPGADWMLYWDPEARLETPRDWVTPAMALMASDPRVMVANPSWEPPDAQGCRPGLERETFETREGFALGPGFSDQVFLASRRALAAPIYDQRCIARITYPGAHKAHVFEARLAAHMRHHGRLRATSLSAGYAIDGSGQGSVYPPSGALEIFRYARNALLLRLLAAVPVRPRCLRGSWL